MPFGEVANLVPPAVFLLVHLVIFVVAVYFAQRSFAAKTHTLGWGFTLFALAELSYMTYHVDWTVFLFAHTVSEVLVLVGLITIFTALAGRGLVGKKTEALKGTTS